MLLNGEWKGQGVDEKGLPLNFKGTVPGCVHTDLIANGIFKDIYYRDNAEKVQWVENCDFTYTKTFTVDNIEPNAVLTFEGLDTYCDILLNGRTVGSTHNMFIRHEFCVDGILKAGENVLEVKFYSPIKAVEGNPQLQAAFTAERLHTRRIQCTYGWDWVLRFVTMGIYRNVHLDFKKNNEIKNYYIFTKDINPYSAQMELQVEFENVAVNGEEVEMSIISPDGKTVFNKKRTILESEFTEWIDITDAKLWFPNGYGEQPLYTLNLKTLNSQKSCKFGIRKVTVLQIEDEPGSEAEQRCRKLQNDPICCGHDLNTSTACFTLLVNGIKIFCKGGNWVPCEPFPSAETEEKFTKLLELGAAGNLNMLRVWGGGIFEQDFFYEECDRLGIMVTQDFLMACGHYPESDENFIAELKKETEYAAYKLRNHPCLMWWSGDNENAVNGNENQNDYPGYRAATYGILPVLKKLDPQRYFLPSSPYGGDNYSSATRGTTHITYYLASLFEYFKTSDFKDYREFFSKYIARFNAEQPILGMPFASSLKRFMSEEDIYGDDRTISEYHTRTQPALGHPTVFEYTNIIAQKIFGEYKNGEDRIKKTQMVQCEWQRLSMELFRRNKWFSSGIIYWMFNDCWPAANGWAIADYYARPKPAYYSFKRSTNPVIASIEQSDGKIKAFVCSDSLCPHTGKGKLYLYDFIADKELKSAEFNFEIEANISKEVFCDDYENWVNLFSENTVLLCDISGDFKDDTAFFVKDRIMDLNLPDCKTVVTENENSVTVTSDGFQLYCIVDTERPLEENCFVIKKGQEKCIAFLK